MLCLFYIVKGDMLSLVSQKPKNTIGFKQKSEGSDTKRPYRNNIDARTNPKYKEAVIIAEKIPAGSRQGQSYGRGFPKGYYSKGGIVHKYDSSKDRSIVAKKQISSKNKSKWRGDASKRDGY